MLTALACLLVVMPAAAFALAGAGPGHGPRVLSLAVQGAHAVEARARASLAMAAIAATERHLLPAALVRAAFRDALGQVERVLCAASLRRSLMASTPPAPWPCGRRRTHLRLWAVRLMPLAPLAWWLARTPTAANAWLEDVMVVALARYQATAAIGDSPRSFAADLIRSGACALDELGPC